MTPRHKAATDRDGRDTADGAEAIVGGGGDISSQSKPLHMRLLDAGIPVVVCRPHRHRSNCTLDCDLELTPPTGWSRVSVEKARQQIAKYRPGIDTLAMVGGHGIDVLDIDRKAGGDSDEVPPGLRRWGCTITPSGGWHFPVPSTAYGKGDLFIDGVYQGDYVGGTALGGSRLLCFLPGSTRPKYPGKSYLEVQTWDIAALLAMGPPPGLLQLCEASGLSLTGGPAKPAASAAQVTAFVDAHVSADVYQLGAANCASLRNVCKAGERTSPILGQTRTGAPTSLTSCRAPRPSGPLQRSHSRSTMPVPPLGKGP